MLDLLQGSQNGSAPGVAKDDDQPGTEANGRQFNASSLRWCNDVPRNADNEQVAQALVEHDLCRNA